MEADMEVETEARGEEAEIAGGAERSTGCVELDFDPLAKAGTVRTTGSSCTTY